MYSYTAKLFIVMRWRRERGFKERAKLGEAICDGVIVDFLKEKEHFKCSCSSLYYNTVFQVYLYGTKKRHYSMLSF